MLDESLAVLLGLWSAEKFSFEGKHYTIRDAQFLPAALQKPRIPIWVAGTWPRKPPFRRAAHFDGILPISGDIETQLTALTGSRSGRVHKKRPHLRHSVRGNSIG